MSKTIKFLSPIIFLVFYSGYATASLVLDISMIPSQQIVAPGSSVDLFLDFSVSSSSTEAWDPSLVADIHSGGFIAYYDEGDSRWYYSHTWGPGGVLVEGHATSIGTYSFPSQYYPNVAVDIGDTVQIKYGSFTLNSNFIFNENDVISILEDYCIIFSDGSYVYAGSDDWNITVSSSAVPIPAAIWLFGSGLLGLIISATGRTRCKSV